MTTIPESFKLEPWDLFAVGLIEEWIDLAERAHVSAAKIARAEKHLAEIVAWRKAHSHLVKLP